MDGNSLVLTLIALKGWNAAKVVEYLGGFAFDYVKALQGLVAALSDGEKAEFKAKLPKVKWAILQNQEAGISLITVFDKAFPKKLYEAGDPCVYLFYKGDVKLLKECSVAVIGTRKPSEPFISQGKAVATALAQKFVIVSGLALGSDTIAHRATLDQGGKTIAVLPSPIDDVLPTSNKALAEEIVQKGGLLVSEYGTGARYDKLHYIRRDRIQSLLSQSVFVIQADENSGTMYCVRKSLKDGKKVFDLQGNNNPSITQHLDGTKVDAADLSVKFA